MDFNTDYVRQQIKDETLQDLLIKSRTKNVYTPVRYEGKTYWCLDDLAQDTETKARARAIRDMSIAMIIAMISVMGLLYMSAQYIL